RCGRVGDSLGQHPPAQGAQAGASDLVPVGRALAQCARRIARAAGRIGTPRPCTKGQAGAKECALRAVSSGGEQWFYTPLVGSSILSPPTSLRARRASLRELRPSRPAFAERDGAARRAEFPKSLFNSGAGTRSRATACPMVKDARR